MDIHARYAIAYALYENAVAYEMDLMDKVSATTNLHARRVLLREYGDACSLMFARERVLNELREEMRQQKPARFIDRIFRKKK